MICNVCGVNEASIHLTEIHNQQMMEVHLCEVCAQEKGTDFKTHFNFHEIFGGTLDPAAWLSVEKPKQTQACPQCSITLEELSKTGRLGCAYCYDFFEKSITPLIRRVQRSVQHCGKHPKKATKPKMVTKSQQDLLSLQKRLRECVQDEAFEEAAKLRDEIRKVEQKQSKPKATPKKKNGS